jgi:hypothetical protein
LFAGPQYPFVVIPPLGTGLVELEIALEEVAVLNIEVLAEHAGRTTSHSP